MFLFEIKKDLLETEVYREGRGLRIMVKNLDDVAIVKEIIKIEMDN